VTDAPGSERFRSVYAVVSMQSLSSNAHVYFLFSFISHFVKTVADGNREPLPDLYL
jgi:hypothetical protein